MNIFLLHERHDDDDGTVTKGCQRSRGNYSDDDDEYDSGSDDDSGDKGSDGGGHGEKDRGDDDSDDVGRGKNDSGGDDSGDDDDDGMNNE